MCCGFAVLTDDTVKEEIELGKATKTRIDPTDS